MFVHVSTFRYRKFIVSSASMLSCEKNRKNILSGLKKNFFLNKKVCVVALPFSIHDCIIFDSNTRVDLN